MRCVGMAVACNAIASGMVANKDMGGALASNALMGASTLGFLGDHCGIPFAGLATALIGGVAVAYAAVGSDCQAPFLDALMLTPLWADSTTRRSA